MRTTRAERTNPSPDNDITADITQLLHQMAGGDAGAADKLFVVLYDNLRNQARRAMHKQPKGHTLQATALVHEAFLKLLPGSRTFKDRAHFLKVAAVAMRTVLIDHARGKRRGKRKTPGRRVELDELLVAFEDRSFDLIDIDAALKRLGALDALAAQVVELRFFGGLDVPEVAKVMEVPLRTVERKWKYARTWLFGELS